MQGEIIKNYHHNCEINYLFIYVVKYINKY